MEVVLCPAIKTKLNICTAFPLLSVSWELLQDFLRSSRCLFAGFMVAGQELNGSQMLLKTHRAM